MNQIGPILIVCLLLVIVYMLFNMVNLPQKQNVVYVRPSYGYLPYGQGPLWWGPRPGRRRRPWRRRRFFI